MIKQEIYDLEELPFLIYKTRIDSEMSQKDLAEKMNINPNSRNLISRLETNKKAMSINMLSKLSKAFGLKIRVLVEYEKDVL